ncbi:MAG: PTS-dependent dihydroxyacetone kinase phosphotransferase subunit DhaM [Clostridiales bacterium]|nr:PTS-dependent dihydroxyacetone kinase phosphotransferase subunit DhaM [Clostridiales bacterium]
MIGVVIVSHSAKVAEGVKDIAEQMNAGGSKIIAAGGAEGGRIGTNPVLIKESIEELKDLNNILVFVDLGSAVMSSEMAIDMLDDELSEKVKMMDTPLVEGVIAAVVQASTTDDIDSIIATAEETRDFRKIHG